MVDREGSRGDKIDLSWGVGEDIEPLLLLLNAISFKYTNKGNTCMCNTNAIQIHLEIEIKIEIINFFFIKR